MNHKCKFVFLFYYILYKITHDIYRDYNKMLFKNSTNMLININCIK